MPRKITFLLVLLGCSALLTCGCGQKNIRHLNSDVALLKEGNSQQEVLELLGEPYKKEPQDNGEQWTYVEAKRSLLKRIWLVTLVAGTTRYEIIHVSFQEGQVKDTTFRYANEEEFKQAGLSATPDDLGGDDS
ncbi:MAG: outer membrane protein assembly factor BamE [Thermodesulfobacteriota bacterium]